MRGLGNVLKGAVFIAGLGVAASALAQKDPQTSFYLDNVTICPSGFTFDVKTSGCVDNTTTPATTDPGRKLTTVTLAREGPPGLLALPTYAAYDVYIVNNTTNALNRLYFTLTVADDNNDDPNDPNDKATFNTIYASGDPVVPTAAGFNCSPFGASTLSCTSDISLNPKTGYTTQKIVVVVNAPTKGTRLTVTGSAGGYEGNSTTGKGCCSAPLGTARTALIDSVNDATFSYTLNAITFVKGTEESVIFTGNKGKASTSDPFGTNVNVPPFFEPTGKKYDIGEVYETFVSGRTQGSRCKDGNRFVNCYQTSVMIPQVFYNPPTPSSTTDVCTSSSTSLLTVVLTIDSSLIKGNASNFDESTVQVRYTANDGTVVPNVPNCQAGVSAFPCICSRYQYPSSAPTPLEQRNDVDITIKNTSNGVLEFF